MTLHRELFIGNIRVPDWELQRSHEWAVENDLATFVNGKFCEVMPDGVRILNAVWDHVETEWVLKVRGKRAPRKKDYRLVAREQAEKVRSEERAIRKGRVLAIVREVAEATAAAARVRARAEAEAVAKKFADRKPDAPHNRVRGVPAKKHGDPFEVPNHYGYTETWGLPYYYEAY